MSAPVTVAEVRERARRLYEREARGWAASADYDSVMEVPLHPPTERVVLGDQDAALAWVETWRTASREPGIEVEWANRVWPSVGSQTVPVRAVVRGAAAIAGVAREGAAWRSRVERTETLRAALGPTEEATLALRTQGRAIADLAEVDVGRLAEVLAWLREHPASDRLVRELPIRGVDTKWIEKHRGVVLALHRAATGEAELGLRDPGPLVRVRFLDPALAPGGLPDVSAPVEDLARLPVHPDRVVVVENLTTMLAMPDAPGTAVAWGGGYRVDLIASLPWAQRVTYWGDLDSHGFAILHQLRSSGVESTSVLMDAETLLAHRDLWGVDPQPNVGVLPLLTEAEQETLARLGAEGNVRLEQERIPWAYALEELEGA